MDLGVGEMRFIFCGKHPLLVIRTQVSDPGPMRSLVIHNSWVNQHFFVMDGSFSLINQIFKKWRFQNGLLLLSVSKDCDHEHNL